MVLFIIGKLSSEWGCTTTTNNKSLGGKNMNIGLKNETVEFKKSTSELKDKGTIVRKGNGKKGYLIVKKMINEVHVSRNNYGWYEQENVRNHVSVINKK